MRGIKCELRSDTKWRRASHENLSFSIEDYKTNCCGLHSFEAFDWNYLAVLNLKECEELFKLAEGDVQSGTGIIVTIPEETEGYYNTTKNNWDTLAKALRKRGFRCIKRFKNSNSDNFVKLFFKLAEREPFDA